MAKEQSIKGEKGFQSFPKQLLRTKKISLRVTPTEQSLLNDYCKEHGIKMAELIRSRLKDIIDSKKE
jgi:hypothetical protein